MNEAGPNPASQSAHGTLYHVDSGAGRPVLFLHGWACHGGFYDAQVSVLRSDFRVIVPDLNGHRHAHVPEAAPTIPDAARSVRALIEVLRLDGVVLVGWSMGAAVLFDYVRQFGCAGLAGVGIVDMSPRVLNDVDWSLGIRSGFTRADNNRAVAAMTADWDAYVDAALPSLFARSGCRDTHLVAWVAGEIRRNDPAAMASLWRSMTIQDYRSVLPRIAVPTLVMNGAESLVYAPAVADFIADLVPVSRRATIAASGHSPHLEEPDRFNAVLADFAAALG